MIDVTSGMGIPSDDPDDPPPIPVTYLHVEVERVFRGAAGAEVRLLLPGGVAEDGTIVSVVGTPSLKLDDHVLVGTHSASVVAHGEDVVLLKHWSSGVFVEDRAAGPVPVVRDGQARLLRHSWLPAGPGSVSAEVTGECPADGDDSLAALEPAASWSDLIAAVESLGVGR
ncbi:MAG: hypothetical protein R3F61_17665 [Myxococcota bacterium]